METKYYELLEARDRAYNYYCKIPSEENRIRYKMAKKEFKDFCTIVLQELMEEHHEVLERLKFRG